MKLLPLDTPKILELVANWLAQKENHQWLDFGNGRQLITPALLKIMAQRPTHFMRAYTSDRDDTPVGICGLNSVDFNFKSATLWGAAGDKLFRNRGLGTLAASKVLTLGFRDLGLNTINTWVVDGNPSLRLIQRLNFNFIGRLRQCHYIDGKAYDRLTFDLLASEHHELPDERRAYGRAEERRAAEKNAGPDWLDEDRAAAPGPAMRRETETAAAKVRNA
jgi:RimJ/RimL family protein N-acetyltransferase